MLSEANATKKAIPPKNQYPDRLVSWEEVGLYVEALKAQIKADNFRPQAIVGISRGGLIPAVQLSYHFDVPLLTAHCQAYYHGKAIDPYVELGFESLSYDRVLIVDEIYDSGRTMRAVFNELHELTLDTKVGVTAYGAVLVARKSKERLLTVGMNPFLRYVGFDFADSSRIIFPWEKQRTREAVKGIEPRELVSEPATYDPDFRHD